MSDDKDLLSAALNRIHGLEKVAEILAEALEELKPGLAARARSEMAAWARRDTTVAMLSEDEREAVVDTVEGVFRDRRLPTST